MENQPFTAVSMNSGVFMLICCRETSSIFIYLFILFFKLFFFCVYIYIYIFNSFLCVYIYIYIYIYVVVVDEEKGKEFFLFTYVEGSLLKRLRREVEKLVEFILEFSKVASYILLVGVTIVIYVLELRYFR